MDTTTVKLYSFGFREAKTYLLALIFVAGNILFPQLCHFIPQGGLILLPIYFFTLIGAYKYGLHVGLLTAALSPLINCLLFGMPPLAVLPVIIVKSALLAVLAALVAHELGRISLMALVAVVIAYQAAGTAVEWIIMGDLGVALQDFKMGLPGMLLQIFGGYFLLRAIAKQ